MADLKSNLRSAASVAWRGLRVAGAYLWEKLASARSPREHDPDEEESSARAHPKIYWGTWALTALLVAIPAYSMPELRYWILGAAAAVIAVTTRKTGAEYTGFVNVVGFVTINTWSGPVPLIPGLMSLEKVRKYPKHWQFPADPEHTYNGDDKDELPIHPDGEPMVRPLRLVTGPPWPNYSGILNVQMTTKVMGTMRPRVRNAATFWIRHNGATAEEKIAEARRQVNETWLQAVQREWGCRPAGKIVDDVDEILKEVLEKVDTDVRSRGLDIYSMTILHPDLSHAVSKAMAGIPEANARKQQIEVDADANKYDEIRKGEAAAQVKLDREKAESDSIAYRADVLQMEPRELLALEAATDIVGDKTQYIFGANGVAEALGTGMAVVDKFKKGPTATPPATKGG